MARSAAPGAANGAKCAARPISTISSTVQADGLARAVHAVELGLVQLDLVEQPVEAARLGAQIGRDGAGMEQLGAPA